jgi:hypothetical protein
MPHSPTTQEDWTIHALNIHGVFFERRCANVVAETPGWKVLTTNYPVEYPPPNGPFRGKESSLDIWARRDNDPSAVVDVLIECKKANPDFVNWVFFPKHESSTSTPFCYVKSNNTQNIESFPKWKPETVIQTGATTLSKTNDAREVRGDYLKHQGNNKTKTSNAAIQEAAYQVALAYRAIVQEEQNLLEKACMSSEHPEPPLLSKSYLPVIVTTANLYEVEFLPNSTSLVSGEIEFANTTLKPVQSALYEYALPKHLQFYPQNPLKTLKGSDSDTFSRMHILVVHSETLSELLSNLFNESS